MQDDGTLPNHWAYEGIVTLGPYTSSTSPQISLDKTLWCCCLSEQLLRYVEFTGASLLACRFTLRDFSE